LWKVHEQWATENGLRAHEIRRDVQRIALILHGVGCTKSRPRIDGRQVTVWSGVGVRRGVQGSSA
jgi:hypothetical protein